MKLVFTFSPAWHLVPNRRDERENRTVDVGQNTHCATVSKILAQQRQNPWCVVKSVNLKDNVVCMYQSLFVKLYINQAQHVQSRCLVTQVKGNICRVFIIIDSFLWYSHALPYHMRKSNCSIDHVSHHVE